MRSPHSTTPRTTITAASGGWLATCTCGAETWAQRRPGVDKWARQHQKDHAPRRTE